MNTFPSVFLALTLGGPAFSQNCLSGEGSEIPILDTAGMGWDDNNIDHDLTVSDFGSSIISIPTAVQGIESLTIQGFSHSWMGDTHCVLYDPNGVGYTIWVRPGVEVGCFACLGNSSRFGFGDYTFLEPGSTANGKLPAQGSVSPGAWDQAFDTNALANPALWPEPDENVFNIPLSQINGPAGDWELRIYDHFYGYPGEFFGVEICLPSTPTVCGSDSPNTVGPGAVLSGTSGDFVVTGIPNEPGVGFYGPATAQLPFGCGTRCVGGDILRLEITIANGNSVQLTEPVPSGMWLQYWYRDGGNSTACGTFNLSNVLQVP